MKIYDMKTYNAVLKCRANYETNKEMAAALGISAAYAGDLLNKRISHFTDKTWKHLEPRLAPYFSTGTHCLNCGNCPNASHCPLREVLQGIIDVPEAAQAQWLQELNNYIKNHSPQFKNR